MSGAKASSLVTRSEAGPVTSNGSVRCPARESARSMAAIVCRVSNSASSSELVTRRLCVRAMRMRVYVRGDTSTIVLHPHPFGLEVARRVLIGGHDDPHAADHVHTELSKLGHLSRVVREKPHAGDSDVLDHVARDVVAAGVVGEPEKAVRVDRVVTLRSHPTRTDLLAQAYPPTLLPHLHPTPRTPAV